MRLEGIHHVTAITADARRNVDFYAGLLGLRLVKKTVNFDQPSAYHLYYGDEQGRPGSIMTFFEFAGVPRGRAGEGMIHRLVWRLGSEDSLDFWADRLGSSGTESERDTSSLRFADPEGLELELVADGSDDPPLTAEAEEIPPQHRLLGFHDVRAYGARPEASAPLLEGGLGFEAAGRSWTLAGEERRAVYGYDEPPPAPGLQGGGTVHHIAWASPAEEHEAWRARLVEAGVRPTPIIDRQYFRSIYFREPSGVLFEIATLGPGFAIDEPADRLGEWLMLPPQHEHLRRQLEETLTPLDNPRSRAPAP